MLGAGTQQQQFIRIIRNELMKLQSPGTGRYIADRATISAKPALSISSHHHHHKNVITRIPDNQSQMLRRFFGDIRVFLRLDIPRLAIRFDIKLNMIGCSLFRSRVFITETNTRKT